jgi:RpiR family carbohydrate utilization transcriptional regulator
MRRYLDCPSSIPSTLLTVQQYCQGKCLDRNVCCEPIRQTNNTCKGLDGATSARRCSAITMRASRQRGRKAPVNFQIDMEHLSAKRREIIRPVLANPQDFVLLSARSLGERLGINAATVVRITQKMGFAAYRDFQRYLHGLSIAKGTSLDAMKASVPRNGGLISLIRDSLDRDLTNLDSLRHSIDLKAVAAVAGRFYKASRILIFAGDLAATLATYLEHHLTILSLPVVSATSWGRIMHLSRSATKKDLVIAISFRKGLRQTIEGLQQARAKGAYCVGITDTYVSPIAQFCNEVFIASIEAPPFGASYTAPMTAINALLVACANQRRSRTLSLLRAADREERHGLRWYQT